MRSIYNVLRRPLVTEKSNYQLTELHQYVFEVANYATKTMIKDAMEILFEVTVEKVNIINVPAKRTRRAVSRRLMVRKPGYKKAIITLSPDDIIPFFEGVE